MKKGCFLKNEGFTIVELIIGIVLLSIVSGAILTFIVVSINSYNQGAAEIDMQYEVQLASNQVQDLMIDATKGVSYAYGVVNFDNSVGEVLIEKDSEINGAGYVNKFLYIYEENEYYKLLWDIAAEEIRVFQYANDGTLKSGSANGDLLAEYVVDFSVNLSNVSKNNTIEYSIVLKNYNGTLYSTSNKLKLRNEVSVNNR